jgi:polyphenol oxidase
MNPSQSDIFQNTKLGLVVHQKNFICHFGNIHAEIADLQQTYPQFDLLRVRQTHSDIIIQAEYKPQLAYEDLSEADAHFSSKKNQALIIATADCMPIMIYCRQTHRAAAVHAGWRGVANKITEKTLQRLIQTGSTQKQFEIFVGPSILQNSFEIDEDVFNILKGSHYNLSESDFYQQRNNKYYVDLTKIVQSQIDLATHKNSKVHFCNVNTKTNENFYSYRRGKQTKERNLSFIALT